MWATRLRERRSSAVVDAREERASLNFQDCIVYAAVPRSGYTLLSVVVSVVVFIKIEI